MRRISFNMTQDQIRDRSKSVTRRLGWRNAKVGERLLGVDRLRSKDAKALAIVEVVRVNREPLNSITDEDVAAEGYPGRSPEWFVDKFCKAMKCPATQAVTRIEFRYAEKVEHDHLRCERLLRRLSGEDRMCSIADDGSHGIATHAMPGLTGGILPRCTDCFTTIYGPHDCASLGCVVNPCPNSGKMAVDE